MKEIISNYDLQVDMAKAIFLAYDQQRLIRKFGLEADEAWLYLTYLNTPCRISRKTGRVEEYLSNGWQECRAYETVMTVYDLLCFHRGEEPPRLAGQWCTAGTFIVTGITETGKFTDKIAKAFDRHLDKLKTAVQKLDGTVLPPLAGADLTCQIPVTPFFPVLLQFWEGDEEFPPKLLVLWDRNTDCFLHYETTFYLQGDLLTRLYNAAELSE